MSGPGNQALENIMYKVGKLEDNKAMKELETLVDKGKLIPKHIIDKYKPQYSINHDLKSWTGLFQPIYDGAKKHDIRVLDRDYEVGHICKLNEYEPTKKEYTGRWVIVEITYITSNKHTPCAFSPFALHPASGVLSINLLEKSET